MPCQSISSLSCHEAMPDKLRFRQPRFNKSHTKGSSLAKLKGVVNLKQMVSVQQLGVATHQYYFKLSFTIFQTMAKMPFLLQSYRRRNDHPSCFAKGFLTLRAKLWPEAAIVQSSVLKLNSLLIFPGDTASKHVD